MLFLFVALVVLLDWIINWLRLKQCSQCSKSKGLSKESVLLSGEQKSDLQKKYPQAFVIEGQMKDVTNGKRSRIKSLAKDKEAMSAQMSPIKD